MVPYSRCTTSCGTALPTALDSVNQPQRCAHDQNVAFRVCCAHDHTAVFQVYLAFPISLVQVVTISMYAHLGTLMVSSQNSSESDDHTRQPQFDFPIFMILEAAVYLGAFRVGQLFIDPMGSEADDFEIVEFFNRDLRLAHVFGNYGKTQSFGDFDLPPAESLVDAQESCMGSIPVEFYKREFCNTGVFREMGKVRPESIARESCTSPKKVQIASAPQMQTSLIAETPPTPITVL